MGFPAPPGGSILHNSRRHHFLAGTRVVAPLPLAVWQGWGVLPKLLLLPVHFVPRMGLMFKPLPGQCACFLKNLVPPVPVLGSPARPSTKPFGASLLPSVEWGCPFLPAWVLFYFLLPDLWQGAYWKFLSTQMSSPRNSILEKITFCIPETASRLFDCPQHLERNTEWYDSLEEDSKEL